MKRISLVFLFSLLLTTCFSPSTLDNSLKNKSTKMSTIKDITPTISEPQKELTVTPAPTNTPTLTPEPEPTKVPEPDLDTYGHRVEWLDPKMQTILEDLVDATYERFLPLDGFSFEPKAPIVNIKDLPEGTVCYGWEYEGSINCLYAEKGVDYYCDDNQNGWPVCYPPDYVPEEGFVDGNFLTLRKGLYGSIVEEDKERFKEQTLTSNMKVGLGSLEESDFVLSMTGRQGIYWSACRKSKGQSYNVVFAVPLARYGGFYPESYLDIGLIGAPEPDCNQNFTIWDLNP